jgi:lipopolysaccharide transport system ATP-binding protein
MNVIEFNSVWKKFKKGEKLNSIRDAVPNFFKRALTEGPLKEDEFWAVKDVSFQIKKGDVVGIMGPNGAGKSTILKLLSRIIVPTKGDMKIHGRLSALIEVTAGFHPELTGRENVYLNGTILGMRKKEIDRKFDEIVEFSGVKEFIDTPVKRYSSGMYSRLGFSVAAHMDPEVLLVDEVLAVGDISFQAKCAQKMRELLQSGATIVLVSHQLNMIQSLCKRVILLQNGQVIRDGSVEQVIPHYQNIVIAQNEASIRQKMNQLEKRVKVDTQPLLDIQNVVLCDEKMESKESFSTGDSINITFKYSALQVINEPIFTLEIIRPDGVICCSSRTDHTDYKKQDIAGKGQMKIALGRLHLAPGIYMLKLSVWDREMIHAYAVRSKDIIRITMDENKNGNSEAVFLPDIVWES